MTADNDIVNIVDGKFSGRSFIHLPAGDWVDLRAEIVRLRGEVKKLAAAVPVPRDPKAHQWNGDGERCLVCGDKDWMGGPCSGAMPNGVEALRNALQRASNRIKRLSLECPIGSSIRDDAYEWAADADATLDTLRAADNRDAAVPAGEAVAWIKPDWQNPANYDGKSPVSTYPQAGWIPLYTTPPAPVQAAPQEGEKAAATLRDALKYVGYRQDGDLNTLAERAELWMRESKVLIAMQQELTAHHSACELGVVRELVDDFTAKGHHSCARDLKAALQHRGDSRGGEG